MKKSEDPENDVDNNEPSIFKALKAVASVLPTPFYWMSTQGVVLGINELGLKAIGTTREIIGKKPYAFYKHEIAEHILKHNAEVMHREEILSQEEWIEDITTKEKTCFSSIKAPLYNDEGNVIGIVGTSIEITAEKELELLRLENERHIRTALQEKENYAMLARKVAHDINSPVAALRMLLDQCNELPEDKRAFLRRAAESVLDIANNLLNHDRDEEDSFGAEIEFRQFLLVSDLVCQLLSEKKVQYQQCSVKFETCIANDAQFAFINVQKTEFRRAMSNLINNAVDALENKKGGVVTIQLTVDAELVSVEIQDNGKGIPKNKIKKILERQRFTEGKANGHGLGLQQVWDMLEGNLGTMIVRSTLDQGTSLQVAFPRQVAPNWIAQKIHIFRDHTIVILDDDDSIHIAWNLRFASFLNKYPALSLHHFKQGQEALDFLASLSPKEKEHVLLLSDYELLQQDKNGLQIIESSQINEAILVTSYYSNLKVAAAACELNVKILPKQMASVIPIDMDP